MPGGSNLITSVAGSSSRTNGSNSSRLAPMPLISSSGCLGGPPATLRPGRTATRSCRPSTVTLRTSAVVNIGSGRSALNRVAGTPERPRAPLPPAAAPGQPGRVIWPPAARHRRSRGQEFSRASKVRWGSVERGLRVGRRVDHTSSVPASGQHEPRPRCPRPTPGRQALAATAGPARPRRLLEDPRPARPSPGVLGRMHLTLDPALTPAHAGLGDTLYRLKRYSEAEVASREAVRLGLNLATGHAALSRALFGMNRYPEAEAARREAIRLDLTLATSHANLSAILDGLDRLQSSPRCC